MRELAQSRLWPWPITEPAPIELFTAAMLSDATKRLRNEAGGRDCANPAKSTT